MLKIMLKIFLTMKVCACAIQVQPCCSYCSKSTVDSPQAFTTDLVASAESVSLPVN